MKRIVSIDWDFFIEEDPMLDMGHREAGFFLNELWAIREAQWAARGKSASDMMPMEPDGPLALTITLMHRFRAPKFNAIAESHAAIYEWAKQIAGDEQLEIINFDAHHDIQYKNDADAEALNCGNWAGKLMLEGKLKSYTVVYPEWRRKWKECDDVRKAAPLKFQSVERLQVWFWKEWLESTKGLSRRPCEAFFLCRSGCWTPPCYDKAFAAFARDLYFDYKAVPIRTMDAKFIDDHTAQLKEMQAKMEAERKG